MDPQAEETNVQQQRHRAGPPQASRWHLWSSSPLGDIPAPLLDPPGPLGLQMTLPQDPMAGSCLWSPAERVWRHLQVDHRLQTGRGQFLRLMRKHAPNIWTPPPPRVTVQRGQPGAQRSQWTVEMSVNFTKGPRPAPSSILPSSSASWTPPGAEGEGCSPPSLAQFNSCHPKILIICASVSWRHPRTTLCTQPGST